MSGVHTELKKGLRAAGIEADIATFGDLHKNFKSDLYLGRPDSTPRGLLSRVIRQTAKVPAFLSYDVIQSISPSPFNRLVSPALSPIVLGRRRPIYIYVAAGSDAVYRSHIRQAPYYPPHDWFENARVARAEKRVLELADAIVTPLFDYEFTMKAAGYHPVTIPLPVATKDIVPVKAGASERIVVYHPLNRSEGNDFKGTSHIRQAFDLLRGRHKGVDFVERGGMSFNEYSAFIRTVDIIVDQTNSLSYGMSAAYGLAHGQVVLSGNEDVAANSLAHPGSPVINIRSDPEQIASVLGDLVTDRERIGRLGAAGRQYAEAHHCTHVVAARYQELYRRLLG
jgi:glycosyltransferase involved in cell wall biosynthesis